MGALFTDIGYDLWEGIGEGYIVIKYNGFSAMNLNNLF